MAIHRYEVYDLKLRQHVICWAEDEIQAMKQAITRKDWTPGQTPINDPAWFVDLRSHPDYCHGR